MPSSSAVSAPRYVTIATDFHDSPVGQLGQRSVAIGNLAMQRAPQPKPGIGDQLKHLLNRIADALTPSGVRAEGKFRRGLQDFSAKVGDTLGALLPNAKTGAVDTQRFLDRLMELRGAAEPCTSRGQAFEDLLSARLNVHLSKLDTSTLMYLEDKIQSQTLHAQVGPAHQLQQNVLDSITGAFGGDLRMDATLKTDFKTLASVIGNHLDRLQTQAFVGHIESLRDDNETLRTLVAANRNNAPASLAEKMAALEKQEASPAAAFAARSPNDRLRALRAAIEQKASALVTPQQEQILSQARTAMHETAGKLVDAVVVQNKTAFWQAARELAHLGETKPNTWTDKAYSERLQTHLETHLSNLKKSAGRQAYSRVLTSLADGMAKLKLPANPDHGQKLLGVFSALRGAVATHRNQAS
ncbi:MAG: hypothetical protein U1F68_00415 [Gammaproteobacteria bacterium]